MADARLYPFWLDNKLGPDSQPQLIGKADVDLLIVGGGFTGLWSAILAKQDNPGHAVVWLERETAQAELHSRRFSAAIWSRERSGIVHPAKLACGLKRVALELGVRLYRHTPMTDVEDNGGTLTVHTHDGKIIAPKVLFATNAWGAGHKNIKQRTSAVRDRVIATEPLPAEQMERIGWKNRQGVYDTRTQLNYTRLTAYNRIIFGRRVGYFFDTFPQLGHIKFTHAWSGPIDLAMRLAVHFQRYYGGKGIYAGGYFGFGVTATRFGARIRLDILYNKGGWRNCAWTWFTVGCSRYDKRARFCRTGSTSASNPS